jgi:hypothetical protein
MFWRPASLPHRGVGTVSIERVFYCDAEGCNTNVSSLYTEPECPGWLLVTETGHKPHVLHFCTWNCALKYAAKFPPPTVIPCG